MAALEDPDLVIDLRTQPWAVPAEGSQFQVTLNNANRLGGGAMGAVFKASLKGERVAAKTHHAIRDPEM